MELLKEAFPKVSRVAVLWWNRPNPSGIGQDVLLLGDMKVGARALQVILQPLELRALDDFDPAFAAIKAERSHALIVLRNPLTSTYRTRIVDFATKSRLPAMHPAAATATSPVRITVIVSRCNRVRIVSTSGLYDVRAGAGIYGRRNICAADSCEMTRVWMTSSCGAVLVRVVAFG